MIEEAQTLIGEISNVELTGQLNRNVEYVEPSTQSKTITPTKEQQIVEPDDGIFALSKVIVNAIPSEYIIPSGTLNISSNGNYDVKEKEYANVNIPNMWTNVGFNDTPQSIINMYIHAKELYDAYNPTWTSLQNKYRNDKSLYIIPLVDTRNITTMSGTFSGCNSLIEIPLLNTSNCETFSTAFSSCTLLKYVPILNTSKATNLNNMFYYCNNLNDDSLNNILKMCINVSSSYSRAKTLYELGLKSNSYPASRIQALSNYNDFINAGWSIGY